MNEQDVAASRQEAMEKEYTKLPGGNYFNYVDTSKLERLGITQWKPSVGSNQIRIVFSPMRPGSFWQLIYKHTNVGPNRKTFICRRNMFGEVCPICEYQDALRKEDPSDPAIKELNAGRRYLYFVVDISSAEDERKGTRWFDCPISLFNEIKTRSKRKRKRGEEEDDMNFSKYIDVSSPTDGRDISFEQAKENGTYSYVGVELETGPDVPESWYSDLPEFKDILKMSDEDEMLDAIGDQFEEPAEKDESKERASEPETRERSERSPRETTRKTDQEEPAEIEGGEEEQPKQSIREEGPREERQSETRDSTGPKDEEDDMKARVQARLAAARKKRGRTD